jgi:hypothetical protein
MRAVNVLVFPTRNLHKSQVPNPGLNIATSIDSQPINIGSAMISSSGVGDIGFLYVTKPNALSYIS